MNRVCEILGIKKPVVQGPMTWITSAEMAAAVSNAGGLGVLGFSAGAEETATTIEATTEAMRREIRKTKELTDKPFGINVMTEPMDGAGFSKATIEMCKEEGVKVLVALGPAAPDQFKKLKEDGFIIISRDMNPTIASSKAAEAAGADIIVATGCDEGGGMPSHATGTLSAVLLAKSAVSIPVLAAGGIINGKVAKAVEAVGAEGVFAGTRFVLSKECRAAQETKEDIMNTSPDDMIVIDQAGGMVKWRCTPHKHAKEGLAMNQSGNHDAPLGSFFDGMLKGDLEAGINTASNVAGLIRSIDSCEDIVNELGSAF